MKGGRWTARTAFQAPPADLPACRDGSNLVGPKNTRIRCICGRDSDQGVMVQASRRSRGSRLQSAPTLVSFAPSSPAC